MDTKLRACMLLAATSTLAGCDLFKEGDNDCHQRGQACCVVTTGPGGGQTVSQCVSKANAASACGALASNYPKFENYPQSRLSDAVNECKGQ